MGRYDGVMVASIFGVLGNAFLLIIKALIGFSTGSQAMIADASNSACDIFSSIATFIGNRIASKPSDEDHNLGHGKAEYIFSMFISIGTIALGFMLLKDSVLAVISEKNFDFSIWLIVVCISTIIVKFVLFLYTNSIYKKSNNLLMKANSMDHRNDCIVTMCNLLGCLLSFFKVYFIDGIVGALIAILMMTGAFKIFRESYNVLMDKSIPEEIKRKIFKIIDSYDQIKGAGDFSSTPIGYKYQISFVIFVDGNLSTFESHRIADNLEKKIILKLDLVHVAIIHVNPI